MIFAHTIDKVLSGEKSQTRRIVKPGDQDLIRHVEGYPIQHTDTTMYQALPLDVANAATITAMNRNERRLWYVGQSVAIQPGRGQKAVGRIEITAIRREDVREISEVDARAEGYGKLPLDHPRWDFWQAWTKMHDPAFKFWFNPSIVDYEYKIGRKHEIVGWDTLQEVIQSRPAERYQAWVLEFRLVEPAP